MNYWELVDREYLRDLADADGVLDLIVDDYYNDQDDDPNYIVTGCDPAEYDDVPF